MFEINGFDTAGVVSLKRVSLAAALKKARELIADGCWDVQVVNPAGQVYTSFEEKPQRLVAALGRFRNINR
jgi:hypothetical protein